MFDCGPATTHKLVKAGLFPTQIDFLFFTHHHSDHNADYPCFLLCRFDQSTGRENVLSVYGPSPTEEITEQLFGEDGAFSWDWKARINNPASRAVHKNRGGSLPRPKPQYQAKDVGPGLVVEHNGWQVNAEITDHQQPWLESLAYRFDSDDGSIVFAGDTAPSDLIADLAQGADVLVVNVWDLQAAMDANGEASGQTGTRDAGRMGRDARVKTLICTHIGPALAKPGSREKGIAEIASIFGGEIIFSDEGMVVDL